MNAYFVLLYKHWYECKDYDFSEIFKCNQYRGSNTETNTIYVEGTAKFELDGKMIPVVITCRPERRKEDAFVEEALSYLRADDPN